ncbi:MAG TPA: hypothetical protein IAB61_01805 [Candidatus Merdisoma merdipullorum]|nr:hypothetical protein [Candidatus Merdisoma merdipullorum]
MENEVMIQQERQGIISPFADSESFQKLFNIGKMWASSELVPSSYRGKPMDCTIAIDMANRMGVSPMMVMQNLGVIRGNPSWNGQACMTLIRASGNFRNVHYVYFGEKGKDSRGCYVSAIKKSTGEEVIGPDVSIKMAKEEGWYDKTGSKWKTMPELMLGYRAAAFFARLHIPERLMGCAVEGEIEDIQKLEAPKAVDAFSSPDQKTIEETEDIFK